MSPRRHAAALVDTGACNVFVVCALLLLYHKAAYCHHHVQARSARCSLQVLMATGWNLYAFIFGLEYLEDDEKEQCFSILDGQGFSAPSKRRAFLALDDADLEKLGISQMSTRKALLLELAGEPSATGDSNRFSRTLAVATAVVGTAGQVRMTDQLMKRIGVVVASYGMRYAGGLGSVVGWLGD